MVIGLQNTTANPLCQFPSLCTNCALLEALSTCNKDNSAHLATLASIQHQNTELNLEGQHARKGTYISQKRKPVLKRQLPRKELKERGEYTLVNYRNRKTGRVMPWWPYFYFIGKIL